MTILECGIIYSTKTLVSTKFAAVGKIDDYDSDLRAGFITALDQFSEQMYGTGLNMVKMKDLRMIIYTKKIQSYEDSEHQNPITCYCIIDKDEENIVKPLLEKILSQFLNRYSSFDITNKEKEFFIKFEDRIKKIFGDLVDDVDDRVNALFS